MAVTYEKAEEFNYPFAKRTVEDEWMSCPPPSIIPFAGTLIINVLHCCAAGFNQSNAPMEEESYHQIYALLLIFIEDDWNHPQLGGHVQSQLEKAINTILAASLP
ncbi:hypothetical protein BDM02DRAFT_3191125 [Thelephora ganbajun]|uniref:Uncharacterized protein n=1 Tax=Thelephora ganbajun TaxID=370292 RepID=A0ACB6Z2C7_THEGA|nr:hypothetical protein BDM02DRAFT_3191125 [Thelephora ganbajun]